MVIDRQNPVALYYQVANYLREQINSRHLQPGTLLPSEQTLIQELGVSRITVRQALDALEREGLVYRVHGKGTYVNHPRIKTRVSTIDSFTHDIQRMGKQPGTVLIERGLAVAPPEGVAALGVGSQDELLRVVRLRTADQKPIALAISWLNTVLYPALHDLDYSQLSLYELLETELGLKLVSAQTRVQADLATEAECTYLQLTEKSPVLRLFRTSYVWKQGKGELPIEYVEATFDGHKYSVEF